MFEVGFLCNLKITPKYLSLVKITKSVRIASEWLPCAATCSGVAPSSGRMVETNCAISSGEDFSVLRYDAIAFCQKPNV